MRSPGMRRALTPAQVASLVDFVRDLAPMAPIGHPPAVLRMAESAAKLSLCCTAEEAEQLAPVLIDCGVIAYRDDGRGSYHLVVPHGEGGRVDVRREDLDDMAAGEKEGGAG